MTDYFKLIAKRLSGEILPEEWIQLQSWITSAPENELLFRRIEESWQEARYQPRVKGQERTFEDIARKLEIDFQVDQKPVITPDRHFWLSFMRYAAVFLVMVAVAATAYWFIGHTVKNSLTEESNTSLVVKNNPRGRKSLITLPDGSRVKLNSESYIEYRDDFRQNRKVNLVGEAFFKVVRDTLHPFVVNTGNVSVRVLGTSFNIRAYPFEETMSVAVASGKVRVSKHAGESTIHEGELTALEILELDHNNGMFLKGTFNPAEFLAWKDGILAFKKASFGEIVDILERWYGVDFVIERDAPITEGFTGKYNNPSLEVVLEGMSFSSDFKYLIEGEKVIIK